jgi:pentatricopeptide repeat protein
MKVYHIYIIGIILCIASCTRHSHEWEKLQDVETYIVTNADSALVTLQNIQPESLINKEEKAKYALLLSMAMDKNYIDRTDFEVLQPAIDYYSEKGTPDEKLRTYYYQGRIYQNKGDNDLSMKAFINARELKDEITDTLTYANLLVAQGTFYYSSYKIEEFIDNNLQAARLYQAIKRSYYQMTSLASALDGSIINKDKQMADSIMTCCKINIKEHPDYGSIMIPYVISYTIVFESDDEIRNVINSVYNNKKLSNNAKLDIAYGYSKIGEVDKALQVLESMHIESIDTNSLKYLSIKADVLEANDNYKDALSFYKLYSSTLEKRHKALFSQDLLFAQERHNLEVASLIEIQKRDQLIWYSICCAFALLSVIGVIYYRYRIGKTQRVIAEQENDRLRLEQENLSMRISQLESESENLKNLLSNQKELPEPITEAIRIRIEMLNSLLAAQISDNEKYAKPYSAWIDEILKNKDAFMDSTRLAFMASHPRFMNHLEEHGLTEAEQNYLCLYAIGLRGKEIGEYIQLKRHYHISSDIRKKLGIDEHETNIGIYIRKLMKTL